MRRLYATLVILAGCGPIARPASSAAHVARYQLISNGHPAGAAEIAIAADGTRTVHYKFDDRGRGADLQTELRLDDAGAPRWAHTRGVDYLKAPVEESLDVRAGELVWSSTGEKGHAPAGSGWYTPNLGPFDIDALVVRTLRRAPDHRVKLLPAGEAWIEDDTIVEVAHRQLHHVAVGGLNFVPDLVWLDERGELFGSVSRWTSVIAAGGEAAIPELLAADEAWRAAHAATLAARLARRPPAAGVAITHARLFDSETRTSRDDVTVLIAGDRITAVGDATTAVPPGAEVIDAHGRTLLPGLWDMHVHLGGDGIDGVAELATGITTVRDMGNDIDALAARAARFEAGTELGPRVLRAGLIDGPGKFTAPTGLLAASPEEARAAVSRYADLGYAQIKVYSSVQPALVPVIAAAAHARGLRVSGHIPNGMTAAQAVEAGYDEIQHANFLFLQFLVGPGDDTRTPLRFTRVAERAASFDLGAGAMTAFLDLLVAHHTVLDPTLVAFEAMFSDDPSDVAPAILPYLARLPAQVSRGLIGGGLPATGTQRATFRSSFAALGKLVKLAWDRGITIVAGTDDFPGVSLPRELELYVAAGIPSADVLALATIGAARVMGKDAESGSIAVGKRADLMLVDGDPVRDIATIRNADVVMCRGLRYDPDQLFGAIGMRPRR